MPASGSRPSGESRWRRLSRVLRYAGPASSIKQEVLPDRIVPGLLRSLTAVSVMLPAYSAGGGTAEDDHGSAGRLWDRQRPGGPRSFILQACLNSSSCNSESFAPPARSRADLVAENLLLRH